MGVIDNIKRQLAGLFSNDAKYNPFNDAFLWAVDGGGYANYDDANKTYIEKGYNINPMVYAPINQMSLKTASVPIYVKKIEDEGSLKKLMRLRNATKRNMTMEQKFREAILETKTFEDKEYDMPMPRPNETQTWTEFLALYKTFLKTTGNAYIYMLTPDEGADSGTPIAVYLLPSHLMQIVIKPNSDMLGVEDPVSGYILTEGRSYLEFSNEEVIHIKYSNPNYGQNGEHLYGMSPLRAALKNIESANSGLDLNIKTLKSGGAFGFLHGEQTPITPEQAAELKERLKEMNNDPSNLGKIAGVSAKMGFTRISLTSEELKPFDYLRFDQKMICNVLGWSDKLLNNDDGAKYDNMGIARRQAITDNIIPDLDLLIDALNEEFLPKFEGYENMRFEYDVMELPEMQEDAGDLSQWLYSGLDRAVFSRNEVRKALRWVESEEEIMNRFTVSSDIISLDEAIDNDFNVEENEQI